MNLLLQAIQSKRLTENSQKASSYPSWYFVFALVFAAFYTFSPSTLSAQCNDVTDGGTIAANQTACGDPFFDPEILVSTSPASGGSGTLQYLWMSTTDDPNGTSSVWNIIPGSSGASYDPGPISQSTSYRRCARRAGCTLWVTESNIVTIELDCSLPSIGDTVFFDQNGNGIQDNNEPGVSGVMVKLLDAGPDGIFGTGDENIISTVTTDANGQYLFVDVDPGTYIIEFMSNSLPDGFTFTTPNVGDDANDSDADSNGQTDPFTVGFGDEDDLTFDAGLVASCDLQIKSITGVNPMCNPGNTGIVALSIMGGVAPITYQWSNGDTTEDINFLPAGTYCVTITDANGCTQSDCVTLIAPDPITVNSTFNPEVCNQANGNIDLTVSGGTAPYTYVWNNGATTQDLNNLVGGTYCVTITDAKGCRVSECFVINSTGNNTVTISPNNSAICPGETITLNASGSAGNTYSWSATGGTLGNPNAQNTSYTMMLPGTYTITVISTTSAGCSASATTTVIVNQPVDISGSVSDAGCGVNDGSITLNLTSGTAPFTYAWSTGATTQGISNVAAGTYCVTVTDTNGCNDTECFTVNGANATPVTISGPGFLCPGQSINLSANSADAVSYSWTTTGGNLASPNAQSTGYTMMMPGTYTITVVTTNSAGCTSSDSHDVVVYEDIIISNANVTDAACGANNGAISISTSSGIAPFSYAWSNGATSQNINGLAPGNYCVTISDAVGCHTATECYTVQGSPTTMVTGTVVDPTCGSNNGSITTILNPNLMVTYSWSTGQTTPNLSNLSAGDYTVTVTTTDGCVSIASFTLVNEGDILLTLNPNNPSCQGMDDGSVNSNVTYSGSGTLLYTWNTGATTPNIDNLPSGNYCVTVTSSDGCEAQECVTLTAPQAVSASAFISGATCGNADGKIKLTVTGGTAPYKYDWSNGDTTQEIDNLAAGEYCVTVCDANGCTFTGCFTVQGGINFNTSIQANNVSCHGGSDGSASASTDGGTSPFTYSWNTGATTSSINNLPAGSYCVTVTDVFGCNDSECVTISQPAPINISVNSSNTTCGIDNGSASVSFGFTASSVTWSGQGINASTNMINNLAPGTYTVEVVSTAGCIVTDMVTIAPSNPLSVNITPLNSTICPGETVAFTSTTSSAGTSYSWSATGGSFNSTTSANPVYTMMMPGTYTITLQATNAAGCTTTETATVTVRDNDDPICDPNSDSVNIGDYVWFDINNNGIQDPNELGIEGIEVKLLTAGPDGVFYTADDVMIATEITDSMGFYLFEDVAPGDYIIMFCNTLPDTEFTTQDAGGNDALDSDANPLNGKTDPFTVVAGQDDDLSFDAGIVLTISGCDNITDAGDICCDQQVCGAGSIPDLISSTSMASGGSGAIEYIWMTTNLPGPFNMNTWNAIPGATGADYQPGPIFETTFIARCARRAGCESYFETDIIKLELLPSPAVSIESLPAFICVGETDNFNSTSAGSGGTYSWDLGEGASPATATGQSLTNVSWNTTGNKTITLTTTNSAGCTFVITRTVNVGSCLNQSVSDRFINFSVTPMEESMDVDLKWNTNEDMNDFHFVVEHSVEGEEFEIIKSMDGNEAYDAKDYTYLDESVRPGRNYYRIKHINNNGQTEKSETLMVTLIDRTEKFILFPNPTVDYVMFESLRLTDEEGVIVLTDMKGMIIKEIVIPPNTERMRIDVRNLSPGSYALFTKYIDVRSVPQIIFKSEK